MTDITIKISSEEDIPEPAPIKTTITARLRKTLDGDLVFYDHEDIDIAISPEKRKIFAFPKDVMDDKVYGAQDRLFTFLRKKGLVSPESIQGGNYFGSMEAAMPEKKIEDSNDIQLVLLNVYKFIEKERPEFMTAKYIKRGQTDNEVDPTEEDSTEMGEIPHSSQKGSMDPRVRPYGFMYNYSLLREKKGEK
jgi:hypothetical protein